MRSIWGYLKSRTFSPYDKKAPECYHTHNLCRIIRTRFAVHWRDGEKKKTNTHKWLRSNHRSALNSKATSFPFWATHEQFRARYNAIHQQQFVFIMMEKWRYYQQRQPQQQCAHHYSRFGENCVACILQMFLNPARLFALCKSQQMGNSHHFLRLFFVIPFANAFSHRNNWIFRRFDAPQWSHLIKHLWNHVHMANKFY